MWFLSLNDLFQMANLKPDHQLNNVTFYFSISFNVMLTTKYIQKLTSPCEKNWLLKTQQGFQIDASRPYSDWLTRGSIQLEPSIQHYDQNGKHLSVSCKLASSNVARKSPNPAMPSNKEFGLSGLFFKLLKLSIPKSAKQYARFNHISSRFQG